MRGRRRIAGRETLLAVQTSGCCSPCSRTRYPGSGDGEVRHRARHRPVTDQAAREAAHRQAFSRTAWRWALPAARTPPCRVLVRRPEDPQQQEADQRTSRAGGGVARGTAQPRFGTGRWSVALCARRAAGVSRGCRGGRGPGHGCGPAAARRTAGRRRGAGRPVRREWVRQRVQRGSCGRLRSASARSTARRVRDAPLVTARRQGGTPSISISGEKLRKVRIKTGLAARLPHTGRLCRAPFARRPRAGRVRATGSGMPRSVEW